MKSNYVVATLLKTFVKSFRDLFIVLVICRLTCPPGTFLVGFLKERVYVKKPPFP